MKINFECGKCGKTYDYEVEKVYMNSETMKAEYKNIPVCPHCGEENNYFLSEVGQGQMTELMFNDEIEMK